MGEVVEHLETVSNPGTPCPTNRRPQLKRMLLEKTKCHLYFVSDERKHRIDGAACLGWATRTVAGSLRGMGISHPKHGRVDLTGPMRTGCVAAK
jgi:hypothetical protein